MVINNKNGHLWTKENKRINREKKKESKKHLLPVTWIQKNT